MDEKITLQGGDEYGTSPIRLNLGDVNLKTTHGGDYEPIKLDITGSNLLCSLDIQKPKVEVLTDLLHNLIQYRESDLAKLTLIDRESEITDIINEVLSKIKQELISY
jgi:hypothetical protein